MQLYLIRHAQSENNARPAYQRTEDPPITPVGRLQADFLARWIKGVSFDHLITSPFTRTLQTMRYVTDATERSLRVWHDVFEQGGCYRGHGPDAHQGGPGLGKRQIVDHFPDGCCVVDSTIDENGWWFGQKRETDDAHRQRATKVIGRIDDAFGKSNDVVVMIIHAQFKRELLRQMLPTADVSGFGFIRNCSVTKLNQNEHGWQLDWFNSITHLPQRLITGSEM